VYRLRRDDGVELQVSGSLWESALELAYVYGWKPAGTQRPRTGAWARPDEGAHAPAWDGQDYFSYESQRVGRGDARALAAALFRAILSVPDWQLAGRHPGAHGGDSSSPIPSRASVTADGITDHHRRIMKRFAAFAECGGFTIGLAG